MTNQTSASITSFHDYYFQDRLTFIFSDLHVDEAQDFEDYFYMHDEVDSDNSDRFSGFGEDMYFVRILEIIPRSRLVP